MKLMIGYNSFTRNDDLNLLVCVNGGKYNMWFISFFKVGYWICLVGMR